MDVGSDKGSDSDFFEDVRDDVVLDADGPDAAEEASNDSTAESDPAEEAPMKLPKSPSDPTPEEREKHNTTHVPHRPWGAICMSARGREDKHYIQTSKEMELDLPMVVLDYAQIRYVANGAGSARTVEQADTTQPAEQPKEMPARAGPHKRRLLVGRDRWTTQVMAHLVRCKRAGRRDNRQARDENRGRARLQEGDSQDRR